MSRVTFSLRSFIWVLKTEGRLCPDGTKHGLNVTRTFPSNFVDKFSTISVSLTSLYKSYDGAHFGKLLRVTKSCFGFPNLTTCLRKGPDWGLILKGRRDGLRRARKFYTKCCMWKNGKGSTRNEEDRRFGNKDRERDGVYDTILPPDVHSVDSFRRPTPFRRLRVPLVLIKKT